MNTDSMPINIFTRYGTIKIIAPMFRKATTFSIARIARMVQFCCCHMAACFLAARMACGRLSQSCPGTAIKA